MFRLVVLVAVAAVSHACARQGSENFGAPAAQTQAIEVSALSKPAELLRALSMTGAARDAALGSHHLQATTTLKIETPGRAPDTLEESFTLDSDGKGAIRGVRETVREDARKGGMEIVVKDGQVFVRPRFGTFVKRRPIGDEVARYRTTLEHNAFGYLDAFSPWLVVTQKDDQLTLGVSNLDRASEAAKGWRATMRPRALEGVLTVDPKSGTLLTARLDGSYTFTRDGVTGPIVVTISFRQETRRSADDISAPKDAVEDLHHPRPLVDRATLLEDL